MKKIIYYITQILILVLIGLLIYGAFVGADEAHEFFTSIPLIVYWFVLIGLTIAAIVSYKKLSRLSLLLIHAGMIFIFAGSMIASEKGHELWSRIVDSPKPYKAQMVLYEGESSNMVFQRKNETVRTLPFSLALKDFIVEYYPGSLMLYFADDRVEMLPAIVDSELLLNGDITKIRVVKVYENLKVVTDGGERKAVDSDGSGRNPAVELEITRSDGTVISRFVFELFQGHPFEDIGCHIVYRRMPKDYISKVDVLQDGKVVKSADIEVNHPLHFGGYDFYQYSYDDQQHQYTVLKVVSRSGLMVVYVGYAILVAGIVWYFWFERLKRNA